MSNAMFTLSDETTNDLWQERIHFFNEAFDDVIRIRGNGSYSVEDVHISDDRRSDFERMKAHCDAIQIIPHDNRARSWFAGALVDNADINNVTIEAPLSKLQGVFCSDGGIRNISVTNCDIFTESEHLITLSGVINGHFEGNTSDGEKVYARLEPMRIGGRPVHKNVVHSQVKIHSFSDKNTDYGKVTGDVHDYRRTIDMSDGTIYLKDFDLHKFTTMLDQLEPPRDAGLHCLAMQHVALQCGEIINTNVKPDLLRKYYLLAERENRMDISDNGLAFLTEVEGVRYKVYTDSAGHPTVGVGHKLTKTELSMKRITIGRTGRTVPVDQELTQSEVVAILKADLVRFVDAVNRGVKIKIKQHQFDALVSFAFNVGISAFRRSTLLKKVNTRRFNDAATEFMRWKHITVNGKRKVSWGLVNRRHKEIALFKGKFKSSIEVSKPIVKQNEDTPMFNPFSIKKTASHDSGDTKTMMQSKIGNSAVAAGIASVLGIAAQLFDWQLGDTDIATITATLTAIISGMIWLFRRFSTNKRVDRTI